MPGRGTAYHAETDSFDTVGRRWLMGVSADSRPVFVYFNWHTGVQKTFGDEVRDAPGPVRDLDSSNLRVIGGPALVAAGSGYKVLVSHGRFVLRRAGKRQTVLDTCSGGCTSIQTGGGVITWAKGRRAFGFALRSGRRLHWTFSRALSPNPDLPSSPVQHTSRFVYFSVPTTGGTQQFELLRARWNP